MTHSSTLKISPPPHKKQFIFALTSIMIGLIASLTAAELILRFQKQWIKNSDQLDIGMMQYSKVLGWQLTPNWQGAHHHHDFNVHYRINHLGFRSTSEQVGKPKKQSKRIAIIGDSFTFGTGVKNTDTFTQQLNLAGNNAIFSNYGIPGYSTDQELLLFEQYIRPLKPAHLILIVYLGNDLFDNELAYPMQADNGKPFFRLTDSNQLLEMNIPVPMQKKTAEAKKYTLQRIVMGEQNDNLTLIEKTLGQLEIFRRIGLFQHKTIIPKSHFKQHFTPPLKLFFALSSKIQASCQQIECQLSIALLPGRSYITHPKSISGQYQSYLRHQIKRQFTNHKTIQLIDLYPGLAEASQKQDKAIFFPNEGHLNALGHHVVAQEIYRQLVL